jgi:hypothetical protein
MPSTGDNHESGVSGFQSRRRRTKPLVGTLWGGTRWLVSMPLRHFPRDEIGKSAALIGSLFEAVKSRPDRVGGLRVTDGRSFDLEATAFEQGIAVWQLEVLLVRRQRTTARYAYISFALGWLFFAGWGYRLSSIEWSPGVALPALEFAPLCVAFFLYAFKTALQNYQIRTRRVATATEYLQTKDAFRPR